MSARADIANERKRRIVTVLRHNKLTNAQLSERFGVAPRTMKDILETLMRENLVRSSGRGCSVTYTAAEEASCPTR